jgi:hypothetical protein
MEPSGAWEMGNALSVFVFQLAGEVLVISRIKKEIDEINKIFGDI